MDYEDFRRVFFVVFMGVVVVFCDIENWKKIVKFLKFVIEIICIVKFLW